MKDDLNHAATDAGSPSAMPTSHDGFGAAPLARMWRLPVARWLPALMAALLWLMLVYGLPLLTLRQSRRIARDELAHLLQTGRPDAPTILDAFDRATEQVLFSAAGPYFVLGVSMLFLVAHLVTVKRRLNVAERNIQVLRDVVLGVEGVPLR